LSRPTHDAAISSSQATAEILDRCPLCERSDSRRLRVPGRWIGLDVFGSLDGTLGVVRCNACQLVYANPRPSQNTLAEFYRRDDYGFHDSAGSAATGARADFFLQRVLECLPAGAPRTLLDYGAGGGGFLQHACKRGWAVRGFEPAARGLATCRRAGLNATDRLEDLPSSSFGVVTLHHVVEHLSNATDVLRQIRRLLTPDGRLYVEVPNAHSLRARLALPYLSQRFQVDERYRAFPIHLLYYSPQTLGRQLVKAGWIVEKMFTIGLGVDEFVIRHQRVPALVDRPTLPPKASDKRPTSRRRWRHALRDRFLDACLGENLGAIAYVSRG
jgi:SAM-dependent methyltransferase